MRIKASILALALVTAALPAAANELAELPALATPPFVTTSVTPGPSTVTAFEATSDVVDRRYVDLDDDRLGRALAAGSSELGKPAFALDLLDGTVVVTPVEATHDLRAGGEQWFSWVADTARDGVAGQAAIGAVITADGDVSMSALFMEPDRLDIHMHRVDDDTYGIYGVRDSGAPFDDGAYLPGPDGFVPAHELELPEPTPPSPDITIDVTDPTTQVVQIQAGFTKQARNMYPGTTVAKRRANAKADVNGAIAYTNTAMRNTKVPARVTVRGLFEVAQNEKKSIGADFNELADKHSSYYGDLKDRRVETSSDLILLVRSVGTDGICGIATGTMIAAETAPPFVPLYGTMADEGASINAAFGICTFFKTVAHELGHDFGALHDKANSPGTTSGYNFGFRQPGKFRTIMSYDCAFQDLAPCPPIPFYSTPDVFYQGYHRIGSATEDVARKIRQTGPILSAYRPDTRKLCNEGVPLDASGELRC